MSKGWIMVASFTAAGVAYYFSRPLRSQYKLGHSLPDMPVGIRRNNPTNILWDGHTQWEGMVGQDSAGHVIFEDVLHGIRAAARVLRSKSQHGISNVRDLARSWTGVTDLGNEKTYASVSGYALTEEIDLSNPDVQARIIPAIVRVENGFGKWYLDATYSRGIALA